MKILLQGYPFKTVPIHSVLRYIISYQWIFHLDVIGFGHIITLCLVRRFYDVGAHYYGPKNIRYEIVIITSSEDNADNEDSLLQITQSVYT